MAVTKMSPGCNNIVTPVAARRRRIPPYGAEPPESLSELPVWGRESDAATALTEGRPMNLPPANYDGF
jgi:hypothetical protein